MSAIRWPFANMTAEIAPMWTITDLCVDLFLVPMVIWDIASSRRVHKATLIGGLVLIASQPLRLVLSETNVWVTFATWTIGLFGK